MKNLIVYIFHPAIGAGIVADYWYGVTEAGNIAISAIWMLILLTFAACAIVENKDLKTPSRTKIGRIIARCLFVGNIALLFVVGWFVTGAFLLMSFIVMWAKKKDASDGSEKAV